MFDKILNSIRARQYYIFLAVFIGLISFTSYNLGKISSNDKGEIKITQDANIYKATISENTEVGEGTSIPKVTPKPLDLRVVVSKASDTKRYHYLWCGSAKRIKEENKIYFNSAEEAETAGYTLAGNCSR